MVDGEIVVARRGRRQPLRGCCRTRCRAARGSELVFFAFDLLHLDGWDLTQAPLVRRKALLRQLLAGATARSAIQFSDHVEGGGAGVLRPGLGAAARGGGVEARLRALPAGPVEDLDQGQGAAGRRLRRSPATPCRRRPEGSAALALGEWEEGELAYRGKVGTGFDAATLRDLLARLEPLRGPGPARSTGAPKDILWVRPVLYGAGPVLQPAPPTDVLRHAVFAGLREVELAAAAPAPRQRLISEADLATVWVTNPTRRLFGRSGPTKLDVAVYYAAVGDFMLPHLFGRPV